MTRVGVFAAAIAACCAIAMQAYAQETPRYNVVAEYIREMGAAKVNRDLAMKELAEGKGQPNVIMIGAIRNSTRVKLALAQSIHALQSMNLNPPFETLLPTTVELYKQKLELHENMIAIASAMSADKPNAELDYGKLAATMPQITATLDYVDQTLFKQTPIVFLLLVDDKPDSKGHASRLVITREQGKQLVGSIDRYFGPSLNDKTQDWNTNAASVLKTYLTKKGYTFADERKL